MQKNSTKKTITVVSLAGIVFTLCTYGAFNFFGKNPNLKGYTSPGIQLSYGQPSPTPSIAPLQSANAAAGSVEKNSQSDDLVDIIDSTIRSVVGVSSAKITDTSKLFLPDHDQTWSVGSGVIVSEDGYILTNQHVIGDMTKEIRVSLSDGRVVSAKAVWQDAGIDLAVLKVNITGLIPAVLGDAKTCRVGQTAIAIGNPLGLQFQRTVTRGVISATYRTISTQNEAGETIFMEDLLQTDASINPGNSGGPLINEKGEVVGINTIKVTSAEGIGFAVPINIAKPVIESFVSKGSFTTPYFGIYAYDRPVIDYLSQNFDSKTGIYIANVDPGSPAERIGLKKGDVITHINRREINTMMDFREHIYRLAPRQEMSITYITGGKIMEATVQLGSKYQ